MLKKNDHRTPYIRCYIRGTNYLKDSALDSGQRFPWIPIPMESVTIISGGRLAIWICIYCCMLISKTMSTSFDENENIIASFRNDYTNCATNLPRQRFSFNSKKAYNGTSHDKGPFYLNYPTNIVNFLSFFSLYC